MNIDVPRLILALAGAGAAALIAGMLFSRLTKRMGVESKATRRVEKILDVEKRSRVDEVGEDLAGKLGLSLEAWKAQLYWAQLGDKYKKYTVGGILARGVGLAILGFLFVFLLTDRSLLFWAAPVILFIWPFYRVKGAADEVRNQAISLLPAVTTIMAAEMDAKAATEQAVARAGEIPGPIARIIKQAVVEAGRSNRSLLSYKDSLGVLTESFERTGMHELRRLGAQLDRVNAMGVDAPRLMNEIARGFTEAYRTRALQAAANLDNTLLYPMMLFFFVPFMAALMLPLFISLFQTL
jgi:hypothetical protein